MQSIPCMALLAMGIPFLGVGETLAIFMVFVYAFLPILKNTYTGISSISPVSLEVARGIGLTRMQQLGRVELPMATPYIMSGIRIAAVGAVGTMTIAAFAGANGLGWFIMLGMNSLNYPMTVMGAVASAVMAGLPPGPRGTGPHQRGAAASGPDQKPQQSCPDPPQGSGRRAVLCPGRCLRGILCRHHCLSLSGLIS